MNERSNERGRNRRNAPLTIHYRDCANTCQPAFPSRRQTVAKTRQARRFDFPVSFSKTGSASARRFTMARATPLNHPFISWKYKSAGFHGARIRSGSRLDPRPRGRTTIFDFLCGSARPSLPRVQLAASFDLPSATPFFVAFLSCRPLVRERSTHLRIVLSIELSSEQIFCLVL